MKIGEAIKEIQERIVDDNFNQAFGLMNLHAKLHLMEVEIEDLENERVSELFSQLLECVESERKDFQEKELEEKKE